MIGAAGGPELVLASASPRRRELIGALGVPYRVVTPAVEELAEGQHPRDLVLANARLKAWAGVDIVARELAAAESGNDPAADGFDPSTIPAVVLGADTDVSIDGRLLGKARNREEAAERLLALSGRTHEVLGGVVLSGAIEGEAVVTTRVTFREIPRPLLDAYLDSGEWQDRAGAYAVQGLGAAFVTAIDGDLDNVIGLPVETVASLIGLR